ncbi:uncharacterized protein EURHEDRAFT_414469, partial [Aspergillus ruber CBS 135680]
RILSIYYKPFKYFLKTFQSNHYQLSQCLPAHATAAPATATLALAARASTKCAQYPLPCE